MRDYFIVNITDDSCLVFLPYKDVVSGAVIICYPSLLASIWTLCTAKYGVLSIISAFYHIGGTLILLLYRRKRLHT